MLTAWRELHRLERQKAALYELPIAVLASLTANLNRDSKRKPEPFKPEEFCCYREAPKAEEAFSAEVAAVALDLRANNQAPKLLLTVWPQILASAKNAEDPPEVRAYRSDDDAVWALAPKWEGRNCRAGLLLVNGRISGEVVLRDLDKPLLTYRFKLPERPGFGWIEAGHLLVVAE